jgi:hypothetical protein
MLWRRTHVALGLTRKPLAQRGGRRRATGVRMCARAEKLLWRKAVFFDFSAIQCHLVPHPTELLTTRKPISLQDLRLGTSASNRHAPMNRPNCGKKVDGAGGIPGSTEVQSHHRTGAARPMP